MTKKKVGGSEVMRVDVVRLKTAFQLDSILRGSEPAIEVADEKAKAQPSAGLRRRYPIHGPKWLEWFQVCHVGSMSPLPLIVSRTTLRIF